MKNQTSISPQTWVTKTSSNHSTCTDLCAGSDLFAVKKTGNEC